MEGSCSTGQSPQRAVVPVEVEEEEEEEEEDMQDLHVKLNPGLPWQKQHFQHEDDSFHQYDGLKLKEETGEVLHMQHSFLCC
jgi:hypothetical protein